MSRPARAAPKDSMDIRFQAGGAEKWKGDVFLVPMLEGEKVLETCPGLDAAAPYLAIAPAMRDVSGRKGETAVVYGHPDLPLSRVMFLGLGKGPATYDDLRLAFARGVRRAKRLRLSSVLVPAFALERFGSACRGVEEAVFGAKLGDYRFEAYRHRREEDPQPLDFLAVCFEGEFVPTPEREAARRGENAADGVLLARDLIAMPANALYPETFANKAAELASGLPLSCTVLDEKALEAQGFEAHLAVGRGSRHAPRLVVLEYTPAGHEEERPLVLVGKGITFDSGGISLKPAARMHTMKCDMTGAADTLAALVTLARESAPHHVVGVMALAENMPGGNAVKPGDIVTSLKGDTVEIVNTDAEGRLVLCDALAYAQKTWKPAAIVDVATLTGACAVALGDQVGGLFSNDDALASRILSAGACGGEVYWRMPLWPGYRDRLKSPVADICHTASSREGGAITAALFLEHFVDEGLAWAHLDIAGEDWVEKGTPLCHVGPSAFGARTLIELGRGGM